MVIYKCDKCHKAFNQKGHYTAHINKKYSCIRNNDDKPINLETNDIKKYICDACSFIFTRKDSLIKHQKSRCKVLNDMNKQTDLLNKLNVLIDQNKHIIETNKYLNNEINLLKTCKGINTNVSFRNTISK